MLQQSDLRRLLSMSCLADVERALGRIFLAVEGVSLRREDRKKAVEVAALLAELRRAGTRGLMVDAAAGKSYVGLLAVELLGVTDLLVIERDAARAETCRWAAQKLSVHARIEVHTADVGDATWWPQQPQTVVALHACGAASDLILDAAIRVEARWLFLVPCCYGAAAPFAAAADALAEQLGGARQAEIRRRLTTSLVDVERTLRLEAAGYESTVVPFVPPTVTGHNLLWRARRVGEAVRMGDAARRLARLRAMGCNRATEISGGFVK